MDLVEVQNTYVDDDNLCHIDGYPTGDDAEGKTIAVVDLDTNKVIFFDNQYRLNELVKESIAEVIANNPIYEVDKAKNVLESKGYFVGNLWHISDVQNQYECTDEEAQDVLQQVFDSERICGEINETIDIFADEMDLVKKDEE